MRDLYQQVLVKSLTSTDPLEPRVAKRTELLFDHFLGEQPRLHCGTIIEALLRGPIHLVIWAGITNPIGVCG